MAKIFDADSTLQRLRNRYRLVVMNDDTYEEVVTFKLSRLSVDICCTSRAHRSVNSVHSFKVLYTRLWECVGSEGNDHT